MMRPNLGSPAFVAAVLVAALHVVPGQARARSAPDNDLTGPRPRTDEFEGWFHDAGQLLLHTSNRGYFGRRGSDATNPSGEWPAGSDQEYLYAAGLWVAGVGVDTTATSGFFQFGEFWNHENEGCGDPIQGICVTHHGAPSGLRFIDDDRDGLIDEDALDGKDNDSDARIDEDFAAISEQMFRAVFYDSSTFFNQFHIDPRDDHTALGLTVTQESYVWSDPAIDDFVGIEYRIENTSDSIDGVGWEIRRVYLGMLTDSDVGYDNDDWSPWVDDQGAYVEVDTTVTDGPGGPFSVSLRMAYTYDSPGNVEDVPGYLGMMLLGHTVDTESPDFESSFAPREVGVHAFRLWSAGSADPLDDLDRYHLLRGVSDTARTIDPPSTRPDDYRHLTSAGPFNHFPVGAAIVLQVAFVCGEMVEVFDLETGGSQRIPDLTNPIRAQRVFDGYLDPDTGERIHWVLGSPPEAASVAVTPGNGIATVEWDESPESVPDPITGETDFAGYQLERAGPMPSPGLPPDDLWRVVGAWNADALSDIDTGSPGVGRYRYVDSGLRNFQSYWYRVRTRDREGLLSTSTAGDQVRVVPLAATAVAPEPIVVVTNPQTSRFRFLNLPEGSAVRIYTVAGKLLTSIAPDRDGATVGQATWRPAAHAAASGVYFYRISTPEGVARTGKLVVLR
jgi:hypothetical protein